MATEIWVNIGSGNGLLPDGTKPLPELILTDHQWSTVTFILGQFHNGCFNHNSLKTVWKLHVKNFVQLSQDKELISTCMLPWGHPILDVCCEVYERVLAVYLLDPSHKSYNASEKCPTMHRFVTEMCTHVHISVTKWCIVGYTTGALWDLYKKVYFSYE